MSKPHTKSSNFTMRVIDDQPRMAVARTEAAIHERWAGDPGRINQARAFLKRARKSDARRRIEKAARKRNRRNR